MLNIPAYRIKPFKSNRPNVKDWIIDFIVISLFILYTAGAASIIVNDVFTVCVFCCLILLFIYRQKSVDLFIIIIIILWCSINTLSSFINNTSKVEFLSFIGVTIRIIMPYLMVKIIGASFFDKFFNYAYRLVIISTIIYILYIILPTTFTAIAPVFSFFTQDEQVAAQGFYSFVYMHSGWGAKTFRNSGFIWEPGGYACVLIFLLYYNVCKNGFKLEKKNLILSIALLTTVSTAGYLAFFFLIILFFMYNKTMRYYSYIIPIVLIVVIYGLMLFYQSSDFLSGKINEYIDKGTTTWEWSFGKEEVTRVSRLGIMQISLENSLVHPWGDGLYKSNFILSKYGNVSGPSSLAEMLRTWGWIGIITLFITLFYFAKRLSKKTIVSLGFCISMSIVLFSNPFHFKYLIYAIIYFSFLIMCHRHKYQSNKITAY